MSKNAIVTFQANVSGDTTFGGISPFSYIMTNSPVFHTSVTMPGPGSITITIPQIPSSAKYVRILPPTNSSVNKWLMSTSGDTVGLQISSTTETWIGLHPTAIQSFILRTDSGPEVIELYFY